MNKTLRTASVYILLVLIAISIVSYFTETAGEILEPDYSTFITQVEEGKVKELLVAGTEGRGVYKDGTKFRIYIPAEDDGMRQLLRENVPKLSYEAPPSAPWWSVALTYLLPTLLLVGVWFFFLNRSQGGGSQAMNFGRSRARLMEKGKSKVTFADIAGYEEVKEDLGEIVDFLRRPSKYIEMGGRIPKGLLLVGPPGTGKTYIARAVAGEAGVPFFSISGSDFVEMYVGVGASRVRDMFENAKKSAPSIIFIDEIDAVGRYRGAGLGGGHDEREQTLNQLLVEMDGFEVNESVIVMAATNRPDILDPALLRPGRFDRQIYMGIPNIREREEILKIHSKKKPLAEDVDLSVLARSTPGFTAADLENLLNEGVLLAVRNNRTVVSMEELEEAISRVLAGPPKKIRADNERTRKITAYHEAGHAIVGHYMPYMDPIHTITIVPRGKAGGFTMALPKEDYSYASREELYDRISTILGGRIAEKLIFDDITTGAANDIQQVSKLARAMVTEYGMSDDLGPISYGSASHEVFLGRDIAMEYNYSDDISAKIDEEVKKIIDCCYQRAEKVLIDHNDELHAVAQRLLVDEVLNAEEFGKMVGAKPEVVTKYQIV